MISLAPVSVHQGRHYYQHDNYYTRDQHVANSSWYGQGATELGLTGAVRSEDFDRLLMGGDQKFGASCGSSSTRGEKSRRAGLDITFSAPKSVSLAALVGGDKRLELAHQRAVDVALAVVEERYSLTRTGGREGRQKVVAGNLAIAKFQHDTSRALDPQLHTHCVILNAVKRSDGQWRSLANEAIYANSKLIGLIYQNELAKEVRKLGYAVRVNANDTFEIQGYSEAELRSFSKRRAQLEALGAKTQRQARDLVKKNRPAKGREKPRDELAGRWKIEASKLGLRHPRPTARVFGEEASHAELVSQGAAHASERDVHFRREAVESFALAAGLGQVEFSKLGWQMQLAQVRGDLVTCGADRLTTKAALCTERKMLELLTVGAGRYAPIVSHAEEKAHLGARGLSPGQLRALELTLSSRDQFLAWQGVAGAGKTFAMKELKAVCEAHALVVKGVAPSAEAAQVLAMETGIEARTVSSLIVASGLPKANQGRQSELWIVDEAGLLSSAQALELMERARRDGARVVLVGDTRQLSGVEAGNPFKLLQQGGIATAHLTESRRQKTKTLKEAAAAMAAGDMARGLRLLEEDIVELKRESARVRRVSCEYLALGAQERSATLVLAGTNRERELLTTAIRGGLKEQGVLQRGALATSLRARDLSRSQIEIGHGVREGDVLVFHKSYPSLALENGSQLEVVARDAARGILHVRREDGRQLALALSKYPAFQVFEKVQRQFSRGDRVRWTRNDLALGLRNGQALRVSDVSPVTLTLEARDGRRFDVALHSRLHLDHDYVSTVYASQGKTCERVIISTDRTFGKEAMYVAISRAKSAVRLFTADKKQMVELAEVARAKVSAVDLVAQNAQKARAAELARGMRRNVGSGLG